MSTEFVGIELRLMGADGVRRDLQDLDRLLHSLGGKKKFDAGLNEARTQVVAYKGELTKLKGEYLALGRITDTNSKKLAKQRQLLAQYNSSLEKFGSAYAKSSASYFVRQKKQQTEKAIAETTAELREQAQAYQRTGAEIDATKQKLWNAQQAVREFGQASRESGRTFMQTFNAISSKVAHIGSAMQSFGNALTQLTSPFRRFTSGILMGAGFKVVNSFTEGFERGFTRYDTMKKYPKIMAAFGYSAKEAQDSINALDLSVRGLPTGLDEMVDLAQRFTATTGDIQKGTKLAIATNNAFLASMSTDTQKYQGMMQLQDVLGGKKMNAREWNSLVSSMTPAIVKMGESLGYTSENMDEFIQTVRDGKMDNQKFINQLIKIGNEGGVLEAMAQESKDTWQAFFANVGNAASRMTAGVIQSLDEVVKALGLKDKDGKKIESVNRLFSDRIIPAIDSTTASVKKWIQAHPDTIVNFFKDLSKIKVGDLLRGYAKGLGLMAGAVEKLATALGKHPNGMAFLGGLFGAGGTIGKMFTIGGGLLKGLRHPIAAIGAVGSWLFKGKLGGIFGKIAQIFGNKKTIQEAGETAKTIPSVADTFKSAFGALEGLIKAAGAITLVAGTGFVAFKAAKSILSDLKDMVDLVNGGGWDNVGYVASGVIVGIGAFTEIFNAIGTALGPQGLLATAIAGAASFIVAGSFAADMWAIKQGVIQIRDTITELDNVATEITNFKGIGTLNEGVKQRFADTIASINEIRDMFVGKSGSKKDRGQVQAGLPTFGASSVTSITNIINTLKDLQKFASKLNDIAGITINQNASSKVEEIGKAITAMTKAMPNAMKNGNTSYGHMSTNITTLTQAFKQMSTMTKRINKLAGTDVNTSGFSAFVESIRAALEDFKSLSGELMLDIEVKLSPMFGSSVAAVKKNIQNAKKEIEKYKAPISYNIPVNITFSVSTNAWSAIAQIREARARVKHAKEGQMEQVYEAKGGLIYRAHGGGVPWKHRGTDTVPAMLTPGEYVHNKRAVSAFGIDFMRKVNNLDMKGAMNELMHRAGHMANINRGTNITNNNYNNQKVVINNSNAGAGYTFRTASRFVGAF